MKKSCSAFLALFFALFQHSFPTQESLLLVKTEKFQKCRLLFPDGYDKDKSYPLLIALHGNGGDSESMVAFFGQYIQKTAIVAVPEGLYIKPGAARPMYSWFYETNQKALWRELDVPSAEFIVKIVDEVRLHCKIDSVFLFGFSQGAGMAYLAGLLFPARFSGIAAVGGTMPEIDTPYALLTSQHLAAGTHLRILVARGNDDPLVKKSVIEKQTDLFTTNGYQVEFFEYSGGHVLNRAVVEKTLAWMKMIIPPETSK